jgi:hypothetical protein
MFYGSSWSRNNPPKGFNPSLTAIWSYRGAPYGKPLNSKPTLDPITLNEIQLRPLNRMTLPKLKEDDLDLMLSYEYLKTGKGAGARPHVQLQRKVDDDWVHFMKGGSYVVPKTPTLLTVASSKMRISQNSSKSLGKINPVVLRKGQVVQLTIINTEGAGVCTFDFFFDNRLN